MSLLNQVLQDLDERTPVEERQPLHLAAVSEPAADPHDPAIANRRDWVRIGAWSAIGILVALAAWLFHGGDSGLHQGGVASPRVAGQLSPGPVQPSPVAVGEGDHSVPAVGAATGPQPAGASPVTVAPVVAAAAAVPAAPIQPVHTAPPAVPDVAPQPPPEPQLMVEERLPVASGEVPADGYLPLRNTQLPPQESTRPRAADGQGAKPVSVKTAKRSAPRPLVEVREAIAEGELATAEYLLRRRLDSAPRDREARELLIGLTLRGARYEEAGQQLDLGLSHYPGHIEFVLIKARLLAQDGEAGAAVRLLEAANTSSGGRIERLQMLGALYQQQLQYEQALNSYRALLQLTPDAGPVWVGLAISLDALGDDGALGAYRRALQLGGLPAAAERYSWQRVGQLESDGG